MCGVLDVGVFLVGLAGVGGVIAVAITLPDYLARHKNTKQVECDHCYFPKYDEHHNVIGQECSLCGRVNAVESHFCTNGDKIRPYPAVLSSLCMGKGRDIPNE